MTEKIVKSFIIVAVFSAILFILISQPLKNFKIEDVKFVKISGQDIKVELALTEVKQTQGLSGRLSLKEDEGMLFVFERPGNYPFWMKDMNFPIDIIWLNDDMRVVYIKKNARPEFFPENYGPTENAKYVLEIVSGFADKNNLRVGDRVEFIYTLND